MAEKKQPNVFVSFKLGDNVRIKNYAGKIGRIVEYRGPLGPGGAPVYRVQVERKPNISYIELLGNQIEVGPLLTSNRPVRSAGRAKTPECVLYGRPHSSGAPIPGRDASGRRDHPSQAEASWTA